MTKLTGRFLSTIPPFPARGLSCHRRGSSWRYKWELQKPGSYNKPPWLQYLRCTSHRGPVVEEEEKEEDLLCCDQRQEFCNLCERPIFSSQPMPCVGAQNDSSIMLEGVIGIICVLVIKPVVTLLKIHSVWNSS
jgi:hypothetical protein